MRLPVLLCCVALISFASLVGCKKESAADRASRQLDALQKKKDAEAKAKNEDKLEPIAETVTLSAPYDDRQAPFIPNEGPCPEGLWALFPGPAPGKDAEEKKQNEAKRKELAEAVRAKQFLVRVRFGSGAELKPFNAPAGEFPIELIGTIDCNDALGRVAIAWTKATAFNPGAKTNTPAVNVWTAEPMRFSWPMKSMEEAKVFFDKNKLGISARIAFTFGKTEVDKKMTKVKAVKEEAHGETIQFGGGTEDWGAGRLVHADVVGVRIALDREKQELIDSRPK